MRGDFLRQSHPTGDALSHDDGQPASIGGLTAPQTVPLPVDVARLAQLIACASDSVDGDPVAAKACIRRAAELLGSGQREIARAVRPATHTVALASWQERRVTEYVEAHLASNIRAVELARVSRLSTGHFFRAFRASFGETPLTYVAKRRIQHSQMLMASSRATLAEVALECGLFDQPHFTRVFRRIVGMTPGAWRRRFTDSGLGRIRSVVAEHDSGLLARSLHR